MLCREIKCRRLAILHHRPTTAFAAKVKRLLPSMQFCFSAAKRRCQALVAGITTYMQNLSIKGFWNNVLLNMLSRGGNITCKLVDFL